MSGKVLIVDGSVINTSFSGEGLQLLRNLQYGPSVLNGIYDSDTTFTVNKFGYNPDVDTVEKEDVWDVGGYLEYLDNAELMNISSTSTQDIAGGNGLSAVQILGLDQDYNRVEEIVSLNGTTPVQTTLEYLRLYRIRAVSSDAVGVGNKEAAGNIVATAVISGTTQAQIAAGNTSTKMTHYTIPAGYTGLLTNITVSGGSNDDFISEFQMRPLGSIFSASADIEISNSNLFSANYDPFLGPLEEKTDIKVRAQAISSNAQCRVNYGLLLIQNGTIPN